MVNGHHPKSREADHTLALLQDVLDTAGLVRLQSARRMKLTPQEMQALELLMHLDMGPGQLASRLGITSAAASGLVDRLERKGHVRRVPDAVDRRRTHVVMTQHGQEAVQDLVSPMIDRLMQIDARLSPSARRCVSEYLHEVRGAMGLIA